MSEEMRKVRLLTLTVALSLTPALSKAAALGTAPPLAALKGILPASGPDTGLCQLAWSE